MRLLGCFIPIAAGLLHILNYFGFRPRSSSSMQEKTKVKSRSVVVIISLLLANALVVSFDAYERSRQGPLQLPNAEFEEIRNASFENEVVSLDGKQYEYCNFTNVTFKYNGTAGFGFSHNHVHGIYRLSTDSGVVGATVVLFKGFGLMNAPLVTGPDKHPIPNVEGPTPMAPLSQ